LPHFTRRTTVAAPAEALYRWHARPGALERLSPPWMRAEVLDHAGLEEGGEAMLRLGLGPASVRWVAEHYEHVPGHGYRDVQIEGPFAHWVHNHRFLPDGPGRAVLENEVEYQLPLAPLSTAAQPLVERTLARVFAYRHRVTRADVERHAAAGLAPLTVALTGSTGLIGRALAAFLLAGGHRVVRLVRSRDAVTRWSRGAAERAVYWDVERGEVDVEALAAAAPDAVVHLAGEPAFALRWTNEKKRRIWESRTKGTQLLARALTGLDRRPRVLLSGSASGFYGDRGSARLTEFDAPGTGFFAELVKAWEVSTAEAEQAGIRTVHLRTGLVLTPAGGFLGLLLPLFRLGLGGHVASGRHFLPWIALDDVLYAVLHLLASEVEGPVNLSAPVPVTGKRFAQALGGVLRRPAPWPAPAPLLHLAAGEMAREMILTSARMLPQRLLDGGFTFAYPDLDDALRHLLGRSVEAPALP
jgi:uncharacterized protein (TIGR01777 family)